MKTGFDKKGLWVEYTHGELERVSAKPGEPTVRIVVTEKALIEIPKRWIKVGPHGVQLKNYGEDMFFIGLTRCGDKCLVRDSDFGLHDYLDTDEPEIELDDDE